jgi:uncharacterized Zn finger protein
MYCVMSRNKAESMREMRFEVQGSAPEPYEVIFVKRSDKNLSAYCSCPAGENGQYCKHRFNILAGIAKGIVSHNEDDVKTIQSWLPGTDVEAAIAKMRELETEAEKLRRHYLQQRKMLQRQCVIKHIKTASTRAEPAPK